MLTPNQRSTNLFQMLEDSINTSAIKEDFEMLNKVNANRVQNKQLKVIHKKSRIICVLQCDNSSLLQISSEMIRHFMILSPVCRSLYTIPSVS